MTDYRKELLELLDLPQGDKRDDRLFAFTEHSAEADPDSAVEAARGIGELYKRGWALLLCVKALVKVDMDRAREVAETIEDEYNRLRAKHTIEFTETKRLKDSGFDPSWN